MVRAIRVGDLGDYCNQQMEKLLRAAVLETDALLKSASPVDTGRFRASWQVGENAAPGGIAPEGKYPAAAPLSRIGYSQETIGNIYSVHNNLPYAERLAANPPYSKQTAPGWVQGIAKDVQSRVRRAADDIGRNS